MNHILYWYWVVI